MCSRDNLRCTCNTDQFAVVHYLQAIDATEDTLQAQFSVTVRLRRSAALINMQVVCKRIIEASRAVFVWCSEGSSEGSLLKNDHLHIRESGWTVIEELAPPANSKSLHEPIMTTTIMKSLVRMTPEVEKSNSESSNHVGVFTDIVLGGFHENLSILHQNVENLILSEQLHI